jgi:hypothetical protein
VSAWQRGLTLRDRRARPSCSLFAWNAAVGISASFFAYHMLTNLQTGFLVVAAHGVGVAMVRIASARFWGHAVDRIGAGPVVVFCSFGIAAVPVTWFFITPDRLWPIALDAVFAAFLWSGHNIAAFDLTIGLAPRASRLRFSRFRHRGRPGFRLASMLAGQLPRSSSSTSAGWRAWSNLHVLFLLSAVGRLAAAGLSLRLHDPGARGDVRELVRALTDRTGLRPAPTSRLRPSPRR